MTAGVGDRNRDAVPSQRGIVAGFSHFEELTFGMARLTMQTSLGEKGGVTRGWMDVGEALIVDLDLATCGIGPLVLCAGRACSLPVLYQDSGNSAGHSEPDSSTAARRLEEIWTGAA